MLSEEELAELQAIADKPEEILERFYTPLSFGTAGLRGICQVGLNRMNRHIIRNITYGFGKVLQQDGGEKTCILCYDCRKYSEVFAKEAATVLVGMGISVLLFTGMRPTPQLSFAIRHFGADGGINITASHNPKEYNGYKVYWKGGMQITEQLAQEITKAAEKADLFSQSQPPDFDWCVAQGKITYINKDFDQVFMDAVRQSAVCPNEIAKAENFKLVYTPFHGTGALIVPELLRRCGLKNLTCVEEQMVPDPDFSTVASPNPENPKSYELALGYGRKTHAHMVIANDPDCDRIGFWAADRAGEYVFLSANQGAVLLLDYFIRHGKKDAVVTTIVSTRLVEKICKANGIAYYETFTGFKNMAEQVEQLGSYSMAFEEAFGFMIGNHVRDKDGAVAAMLFCELGADCYNRGVTLPEQLESIYRAYGYAVESAYSVVAEGSSGSAKISTFMAQLRNAPPATMGGSAVRYFSDYAGGNMLDLEKKYVDRLPLQGSDVLCLQMGDGTQIFVRPSGTEPKVKFYLLSLGCDPMAMEQAQQQYGQALMNKMKKDGALE